MKLKKSALLAAVMALCLLCGCGQKQEAEATKETEPETADAEQKVTAYADIAIRDYGHGIPKGELPHVKEKFYKGSSKNRGTGIGLSVCDEIITRHGGELNIENADGGGCLVTILLPQQNGENHGR